MVLRCVIVRRDMRSECSDVVAGPKGFGNELCDPYLNCSPKPTCYACGPWGTVML